MIQLIQYIKSNLASTKTYMGKEMCDTFDHLINEAYNKSLRGDFIDAKKLIKTQMHWLLKMKVVDKAKLLALLTPNEQQELHLLIGGRHEVMDGIFTCIDAEVRATGNSLVYAFGYSKVTAFDTCNISLHDHSYGNLKDCRGTAFDDSTLIVRGYGYAEYFDESIGRGSGYSMLLVNDNATVSSSLTCNYVDRK